MIRLFTTTIIVFIILAQTSFALTKKEMISQYPKLAATQSYYTLPKLNKGLNNTQNSLDGYYNNQYRGPRKIKHNENSYSNIRTYLELGIRGAFVNDTKIKQSQEREGEILTIPYTIEAMESNTIKFDPGYGGSLKMGFDGNKNRYELEFSYEKSSMKKWHFQDKNIIIADVPTNLPYSEGKYKESTLSVFSFYLNYYRDFFEYSLISPYIGAGIGTSNVKFRSGSVSWGDEEENIDGIVNSFDTAGSYQIILGTRIKINNDRKININYRYRGLINDITMETVGSVDEDGNEIAANNPYNFSYSAHIAEI